MPNKTSYYANILGQLNGFKDYLNTAEKDTLNEQVNKNPNYFFDILPYAYVLGVSTAWIENFKNNNLPMVSNYFNDNIVTTCFDSFNKDIDYEYASSRPSSSGGGGGSSSSCGGGCSSCGGGCSSCGGGGSW